MKRISDIENVVKNKKIICVTPETVLNSRYSVEMLSTIKKSSIIVYDEIHCLSDWGHDFRPTYLSVHRIISNIKNNDVKAIGLTATASINTIKSIVSIVGIKEKMFETIRIIHTRTERLPDISILPQLLQRQEQPR